MFSSSTQQKRQESPQERIYKLKEKMRERMAERNYSFVSVGWDDCSRGYGSSIGANISDWTFETKDGMVLPFIRGPNYQDKTMTIPSKNIAIVVGNEKPNGGLYPITFENYLILRII